MITLTCPRCGSTRVNRQSGARHIVGAIGLLTGVAGGLLGVLRHDDHPDGPIGRLLDALSGGLLGCGLGIRVGEAIDEHLVGHCLCRDCGCSFTPTWA